MKIRMPDIFKAGKAGSTGKTDLHGQGLLAGFVPELIKYIIKLNI